MLARLHDPGVSVGALLSLRMRARGGMADALDLGSSGAIRAGSSPVVPTKLS